jgi:hypothetical protein
MLRGTGDTEQNLARTAARTYAGYNGITPNENVLIEIPPATASHSRYAGSNGFVRVEVTRPTAVTFMRLLVQRPTVNVRASATAGVRSTPYGVRLLVLKPNGQAMTMTGSCLVDVGDGTVYVDSSDSSALRKVGSCTLNAGQVCVVGGISEVGSGEINATIIEGAPVEPDPLAGLPEPNLSSYPTSPDSGGTSSKPALRHITGSGTTTLRPGIYWGGLKISGSGNVNMLPGTYIMAGGGFAMSGSGTLTGTDIFIFNTEDPYKPNGAGAYGDIDLTGSGARDLRAPSTGTYKGILIFNDRSSTRQIKLAGSGSLGGQPPMRGVVYSPGGELWITGTGDMGALSAIVYTLTINGSATFSDLDPDRSLGRNTVRLFE